MEVRPFVNSGPEFLSLGTDFWVPDWFRFTGCRWNSRPRKGGHDHDGTRRVHYTKKFALEGPIESYKYGEFVRYQLDIESQPGLICSPHARFAVGEIDDEDEWNAEIFDGLVPTVQSARGFHYYNAVPPDLADSGMIPGQGPLPGGDWKSCGFVPAPGTMHPEGVEYRLISDRINIATPQFLEKVAAVREAHREKLSRIYRERGGEGGWTGDGAVNGQDDFLARVCWKAVMAGKPEAEVRAIWSNEAAALPLKHPDEPFTEEDFERHFKGAMRKKDSSFAWSVMIDSALQAWADGVREHAESDVSGDDAGASGEPPSDGDDAAFQDGDGGFLPPGYIIPPPYELRATAVWEEVVKNKQLTDEKITHRPLLVSGVQMDEDGGTSYELTWETHKRERKIVIAPAADIAERTRLVRVFPEIVVTSKGAGQAAEYLACLRTANAEWLDQRTARIASSLGWYGREGTDEFVLGNGRPYEIRDQANLGNWLSGYVKKGEMGEWVAALRAAPWRVQLLVTGALSAPLLRILGARGFIVDNASATTKGKTKGARAAASVWGNPSTLLLSWSDTKVALERYAASVHGLPVIVDESKLARDGDQISSVVYQIAAGISAARGDRSGGRLQERSSIETVMITNGEQPLLSESGHKDGGAFARVLELGGAPFESAEQADVLDAVISRNYGHAGDLFVRNLRDADHDVLHHRYQELREDARSLGDTDVARRRGDAVAVLMLASELAYDAGLLPRLPELAWVELLKDTAGEEGSDDLAQMALEMLWRRVALDRRSFWEPEPMINGTSLMSSRDVPFGGWAGRVDVKEGWVAVSPDWLRKFMADNGMDSENILRQWNERKWIALDSKARRQVMVRVAGRSVRCVKVVFGAGQAADSDVHEDHSSGTR
jgi:hypothetical protein